MSDEGAAVNYLDIHMRNMHPINTSGNNSSRKDDPQLDDEEFRIATTPKLIPEAWDDQNYSFSKGRFEPAPLN